MFKRFRSFASMLSALLLPSTIARFALNLLGHRVASGVRIGFTILRVEQLVLQERSRIGHLNFISIRRLTLRTDAYVGRLNIIHGPVSVSLSQSSAIGNGNKITRGATGPVTFGPSRLRLGKLAKITANHRLDCTSSIVVGDFSTIAGANSELWTHGYVHDETGPGRYRVDGRIDIGNNVYIGSASIITTGVRISDSVIVGAGAVVARNLAEPGMYVSSALRRLPRPANPAMRDDLRAAEESRLSETVYVKRTGH